MRNSSKALSGMGAGVIFLGLLILKLCGKIELSWWWVTCPLWLPFAILVSALVFCSLIALMAAKRERTRTTRR